MKVVSLARSLMRAVLVAIGLLMLAAAFIAACMAGLEPDLGVSAVLMWFVVPPALLAGLLALFMAADSS